MKIGDRVKYRVGFLRSIGCYTGAMPRARGTITFLTPMGKKFLANIEWDDCADELPQRVLVDNLAPANKIEHD